MSDPDRESLPTAPADSVRGFLPDNEGRQLYEWAARVAPLGPLIEIGSYCGRSTIWLAQAELVAWFPVTTGEGPASVRCEPG